MWSGIKFARAAHGVISLVKAIEAKSLIGFATAGAAIVGAGAAIARGASTIVGAVERVANSVARGLQGVSSIRQVASIASAVASGIGGAAGSTASGLQRFANRLGDVSGRLQSAAQGLSAFQSYQAADKALRAAKQALAQAQASGNPQAVARAQNELNEAERAKQAAIFGGLGTAAMIGADSVGQRKPPGPGEPIDRGPAASALEASQRATGRALSGAGDVVRQDRESLGANAIGLAAAVPSGVNHKSSEPHDPIRSRIDELVGLGPQVHTLNQASNFADAALSPRPSTRAEREANQAVRNAEAAFKAAEAFGNPEAILASRANLARVRKSREAALMGEIGASDALLQTAAGIAQERNEARTFATARDGVVRVLESAETTDQRVATMGADLPLDLRKDSTELRKQLGRAQTRFEEALREAHGDSERIEQATRGFLSAQMRVWADLTLLERVAAERQPQSVAAQLRVGRDAVKNALAKQQARRQSIGAGGGFPIPATEVEGAAHGYSAALDRLQAVQDSGASDIELRRGQMDVTLARTVFDATRDPRRSPGDPPPWAVGVGTFIKEFGQGALAVVSLGGTVAIHQAYKNGRLEARSGPADVMQVYIEGVFNGISFGADDASAATLVASLRNVSGYDDLRTILTDPDANAYDKAQAMATVVAKWAGLAALGVSRIP